MRAAKQFESEMIGDGPIFKLGPRRVVIADYEIAAEALEAPNFLGRAPAILKSRSDLGRSNSYRRELAGALPALREAANQFEPLDHIDGVWPASLSQAIRQRIMLPSLTAEMSQRRKLTVVAACNLNPESVGPTLTKMTRGIVPPKIRRIVRTIDGGSRSIGSLVSSAIYYAKKYPKIAQCATPEQIVLETLRCAPPAWTVVRPVLDRNAAPPSLAAYVTEELEEVVISTLLIHHDEKYWQHPDSWLPSRWHQTSPSVSGFMPFGKGTERCFGQSYIFNLAVPLVGRVLPLLDSFCVTEEKAMPDGPLYSVASYELRYCESGS